MYGDYLALEKINKGAISSFIMHVTILYATRSIEFCIKLRTID